MRCEIAALVYFYIHWYIFVQVYIILYGCILFYTVPSFPRSCPLPELHQRPCLRIIRSYHGLIVVSAGQTLRSRLRYVTICLVILVIFVSVFPVSIVANKGFRTGYRFAGLYIHVQKKKFLRIQHIQYKHYRHIRFKYY